MAKVEHEFMPNFKILQAALNKNDIQQNLAIDGMIRGKYQDNLDGLQWMKCYWDRLGAAARDYDPLLAREGRPTPHWALAKGSEDVQKSARSLDSVVSQKCDPLRKPGKPSPKGGGRACKSEHTPPGVADGRAAVSSAPTPDQKLAEELRARVDDQEEEIGDLHATFDGVEQERDFYFLKLREVDVLCAALKDRMESGDPATSRAALKESGGDEDRLRPAGVTPESLVRDIERILYGEGIARAEGKESEGEEGVFSTAPTSKALW